MLLWLCVGLGEEDHHRHGHVSFVWRAFALEHSIVVAIPVNT